MQQSKSNLFPIALFAAFFLITALRYQFLLSGQTVPSEDLAGHIALISQLREQLLSGRLFFYDASWFTGWPAYQFYGFLSHLLLATISFPLQLFSDTPVSLGVHLSILMGLAVLPVSLYFCSSTFVALALTDQQKAYRRIRSLLVLSCCFLAFWWLNHDEQFFGIGAGSVLYVGLLPQLFAWHLLLLYFGTLLRLLREPTRGRAVALGLSLTCLILTHPLTAIFASSIGFLAFLWRRKRRGILTVVHLVGIGLAGFWLAPFLAFASEFTLADVYPAQDDLLRFFFRYPLPELWNELKVEGLKTVAKVNLSYLLFWGLFALLFVHPEPRRCRPLIQSFFLFTALSVILSSDFVAANVPLGIHYYRFQGYLVLMFLCLLATVPALTSIKRDRHQRSVEVQLWSQLIWLAILLAATVSAARLGPLEQQRVAQSTAQSHFSDLDQVVSYLADHPVQGRIFVEHLNDYQKFPYLSCHYLISELPEKAQREVVNGLFIESSLAYRMPVVAATMLNASTYHSFLVFSSKYQPENELKVQQMRDLGVSHIVVGTDSLYASLKPFEVEPTVSFGPYRVVQISKEVENKISRDDRQLVGYFDPNQELPFAYLEFYFYARPQLYTEYALLKLESLDEIPPEIKQLLIVGVDAPSANVPNGIAVHMLHSPRQELNHYTRSYSAIKTIPRYRALETYLDANLLKSEAFAPAGAKTEGAEATSDAEALWHQTQQEFSLRNLEPGELYRLDYSYFPLFSSNDGTLYRGAEERIYFRPSANEATISYSIRNHPSGWIGWVVSGISFLLGSVLLLTRRL